MNKSSLYSWIWWISKISGIVLLGFVGAFASNWANDFNEKVDFSIFSLDSFKPFGITLILGLSCEALCISLEKKIKENDVIYLSGFQFVENNLKQLKKQGNILDKENLEAEIEKTELELELKMKNNQLKQ